ncbi:MAG: SDR family oxidoreductase [Thermodesulfobacteriota bacterium]
MELKGKRVIVVGGSSGIGQAVARAAAAKGAKVIIASRNKEKVDQAAGEIGGGVEGRVLDATKEEEVQAFFERIGAFDHLICTIHPASREMLRHLVRPLDQTATEAARQWMEVKFWGQYYCAKYGARKLKDQGSITLTGGAASRRWIPNHAAIAATNAAVGALGVMLAKEIGPKRCNVVSPGLVDTPVQHTLLSEEELKAHFTYKADLLPVKHVATPEEVALSYIYLLECDFHTADVLVVDGGNSVAGVGSPGYKNLDGN